MTSPNEGTEAQLVSGPSNGPQAKKLEQHLARSTVAELSALLTTSVIELLEKIDATATTVSVLSYLIVKINGRSGALRNRAIRDLLISKLTREEAAEICQIFDVPSYMPERALDGVDLGSPQGLSVLQRWYGVTGDDDEPGQHDLTGSHRATATHRLDPHQLKAYRDIRCAVSTQSSSVLVHMPYGSGKLRTVATAVLDMYRSASDEKSIVWLAPGPSLCEEAFNELKQLWRQIGTRDVTIYKIYGTNPPRDMQNLGGAILVVDMLALSPEDDALRSLGSVTSVAVFADAESLAHPVGSQIADKMSEGGTFSTVGILATPGASIMPESKELLSMRFSDNCITVGDGGKIQSIRDSGGFAEVDASALQVTSSSALPPPQNGLSILGCCESLELDPLLVDEMGEDAERNFNLLNALLDEAKRGKRVVFYATTSRNAKLFAGLLMILGIKSRYVTADHSPETRTLEIQKFIAREGRVLCVHGFLLSGTVVPDVSTCIVASPGRSRISLLSAIGRLVQDRDRNHERLRVIVASDTQVDCGWVAHLSSWSELGAQESV